VKSGTAAWTRARVEPGLGGACVACPDVAFSGSSCFRRSSPSSINSTMISLTISSARAQKTIGSTRYLKAALQSIHWGPSVPAGTFVGDLADPCARWRAVFWGCNRSAGGNGPWPHGVKGGEPTRWNRRIWPKRTVVARFPRAQKQLNFSLHLKWLKKKTGAGFLFLSLRNCKDPGAFFPNWTGFFFKKKKRNLIF